MKKTEVDCLVIRIGEELQKQAGHELLMVLTNGKGLPKPATYPPKQEPWCGSVTVTSCV